MWRCETTVVNNQKIIFDAMQCLLLKINYKEKTQVCHVQSFKNNIVLKLLYTNQKVLSFLGQKKEKPMTNISNMFMQMCVVSPPPQTFCLLPQIERKPEKVKVSKSITIRTDFCEQKAVYKIDYCDYYAIIMRLLICFLKLNSFIINFSILRIWIFE